eukprot:UN12501
MGNNILRKHLSPDKFLHRYNNEDQLSCCWPATTPVNLTALTAGAYPGEHGAVGWRLRVPKKNGGYEIVKQPFLITDMEGQQCEISGPDFTT